MERVVWDEKHSIKHEPLLSHEILYENKNKKV